jgi:hypothetical protein
MIVEGSAVNLPKPNLGGLNLLEPSEIAVAFVAAQKGSACAKQEAVKALGPLLQAEQAIAAALRQGCLEEKNGMLIATPLSGGSNPSPSPGANKWRAAQRELAVRVLMPASRTDAQAPRKKRDLAALALRQIYTLDNLPLFPSRREVRCALLSRVVAAAFGGTLEAMAVQPVKPFKLDPVSRRLYVNFAGLDAGTVAQADAALLSTAFGAPAANANDLSAAIIRSAVRPVEAPLEESEEEFDLDRFAQAIRKLASKLETKPYSGRVAIAQVYDAGLALGLSLGSLDDFKQNLAEAAREGLLDLERYDITGPLDASLKERSRLRLGRDERHFIVNQWI